MNEFNNIPQFTNFDAGGIGQGIAGIVFYIAAIIITILGFSAVYVLLRNGRSRVLSFVISAIYLLFYATLMMEGIKLVNALN